MTSLGHRRRDIEAELTRIRRVLDSEHTQSASELAHLAERIVVLRSAVESLRQDDAGDVGGANLSPFVREFSADLGGSKAQDVSSIGVRYKTVSIDWTRENIGEVARAIFDDSWELHRKVLLVQQMTLHFLKPYFENGWRLDGPYHEAVEYIYRDAWLGARRRLWKVVARLRKRA